ncbi:MAG TPA: hypothetical protein PK916_04685 [Bacteroidota bacterium]|nr:hypothetical protein [Bacteroidota bacterium]
MPHTIAIRIDDRLFVEATDPDTIEQMLLARMEVIAEDAAGQLAEETPVGVFGIAQGAWLSELKVTAEHGQGQIVAVSDPTPVAPYLYYVVHGVKPGSPFNPGRHLVEWVRVKLGKGKEVAYMIGAHIQKHGRKGHDFVQEVIERNAEDWDRILQGAYAT